MGHKQLVLTDPSKKYPKSLKSLNSKKLSNAKEPIVIRMDGEGTRKQLERLIKGYPDATVIDNYAEQYAELLLSKNAHLYQANYDVQVASVAELIDDHYAGREPWRKGSWVYYPWSNQLVHVLAQADFEALRTIRNRDLITSDEQAKLFGFKVACFGMSVGSASAEALAVSGVSRQIKLIDGAVVSGSNLNRILTGVSSVGTGKATIIGRQIYEMNPYSQVEYFDKADVSNIDGVFDRPWPVDLVVDEIDDIEMKIQIRLEARKRKIPVVMASELGDTVVIDVERFDKEPHRPIFHGMIPGVESVNNSKLENKREWMKLAVKILGPENMPIKLQKSLLKIGSTIVTHPQLGSTVMMTGGVVAFAIKNIALGEKMESGRYTIPLEKQFLKDHKTFRHKRAHRKHTKVIKSALKSM